MWYDELPPGKSWAALWSGYTLCENCTGIRPCEGRCPVCGDPSYAANNQMAQIDGREIIVEMHPDADLQPVTIFVNAHPVALEGTAASGAKIKSAAIAQGVRSRLTFVLQEELLNGTSRVIGDNDVVQLRSELRFTTIAPCAAGAEGRYEDWLYLQMLEREWKRPVGDAEQLIFPDPERRPSARATLVILFWSYFETRIARLLRTALHGVPPRIMEDVLQRYSSIGSRLDRLYRLLFETTYRADLIQLGYDDIWHHLATVQERRNAFAHGDPKAIDDALVSAVVDNLKREHEAWIAVFNHRTAGPTVQNRVPNVP